MLSLNLLSLSVSLVSFWLENKGTLWFGLPPRQNMVCRHYKRFFFAQRNIIFLLSIINSSETLDVNLKRRKTSSEMSLYYCHKFFYCLFMYGCIGTGRWVTILYSILCVLGVSRVNAVIRLAHLLFANSLHYNENHFCLIKNK